MNSVKTPFTGGTALLHRTLLIASMVLLACVSLQAAPDFKPHRGVLDATPVSATNPIVARIADCGIEITAMELALYIRQERTPADPSGPVTLERKRRDLEGLIDEHLLVWWAREQKAEQTEGFQNMLEGTRKLLLEEALEQQEVYAKAKSPEEYARLAKELHDRVFEKTNIKVSNEAYNELTNLVRMLPPAPLNPSPTPDAAADVKRKRPLAQWNGTFITVGQVLDRYNADPTRRPDIGKQEGLVGMLKEMLMPELLVAESLALGLDQSELVREKLQLNRAALLRFYAQDRISDRAAARMKEPDLDARLKQWFETHRKDLYTYQDEQGKDRVFVFETEKERVEGDYFEHLRGQARADLVRVTRRDREIRIDGKALAELAIAFPPLEPGLLEPSVVAWKADTLEHIVKPGETNAHFAFHLKNVSSNEVIIREIVPACECTTIQSSPPPWKLAPGDQRELLANVDLRGKTNSVNRSISIDSSSGRKSLVMKIIVPRPDQPSKVSTAVKP